jgi:hypothetical protein
MFSEFSFKFHFESEKVPMETVDPLFTPFKTIFYFESSEPWKVLFGSFTVSNILK